MSFSCIRRCNSFSLDSLTTIRQSLNRTFPVNRNALFFSASSYSCPSRRTFSHLSFLKHCNQRATTHKTKNVGMSMFMGAFLATSFGLTSGLYAKENETFFKKKFHSTDSCEILPLPDSLKAQMIDIGTWKPDCPVGLDRLRLVKFTHYDFSGEQQQGEIVVLEAVASRVATIFETLHKHQFPIAQAKTIEYYNGKDKPSMADNNSSAFNYRPIAGKTLLSVHSYGLAIDINPVQNPCIEIQPILDPEEVRVPVQPSAGQAYLNRTKICPGMVEQSLDIGFRVVELFKQNGFDVWGGTWNNPVDWQHFQPSRATAEWLAFMFPEDAILLFELYIANPLLLNDPKIREFDFKTLYNKNRAQFMKTLQDPDFWKMSPEEAYHSF